VKQEEPEVHQYLRHNKQFPSVWCAGCGIGIVLHAVIRAVDHLGLDRDRVAMISGIGCTGRISVYVDFNTMHTTHGRALAFATGLKMAKPEMSVIVVMGDGDALSIGGNHLLHACRRNIGLTAIVVNNNVYGMTGGQSSPTTPTGALATTSPYGKIEAPLSLARIAEAAGAVLVARSTVYHALELSQFIELALQKKGFSVIEAMSYCHTTFGKRNQLGTAVDMMRRLRDISVSAGQAEKMSAEELQGRVVRGLLLDRDAPEYTELYEQVIGRAQTSAGGS
jgi:2-oxoglutarate ferredoxin oxidoreductase subunit beta